MQIIYLKTKTPISIGDKIKIDNITITITQQFIDDNKDMFKVVNETRYWKCIKETSGNVFIVNKIYKLIDNKSISDPYCFTSEYGPADRRPRPFDFFTPSTEEEYLLQVAKEKYPVGTRFRVVHNPQTICTVKSHDRHINTFVNNNGLVINFIKEEYDMNCNSASVYWNGKWADVVTPIFVTEDNVNIYEGDSYWFCGINVESWSDESMVNYKAYFVESARKAKFSNYCRFFSTKESCQEYIDKHKEKTLNDYENIFIQDLINRINDKNAGLFFKNCYPELYWYKIALLIKDDLNDGWTGDWDNIDVVKYVFNKDQNNISIHDNRCAQYNKFYFRSSELRDKFIILMGDKIDYLF